MGMFDTIHVKTPLICPACRAEVWSLQTKEFDNILANFKVGSVLSGSPVLSGILKETLWCDACYKAGNQENHSPVYLVIWHSLLAGVEQDLAKAEACLAKVDRLDLITWLDEAQRETNRLQQRFWKLFNEMTCWHEHCTNPPASDADNPDAKRQRAFRRFFSLPDEILNAPDPLAAILEANKLDLHLP